MTNKVLNLDDRQLLQIEQIIMDRDEKEALKFVMEINKKLKSIQTVCCDPQSQRARDRIDEAIAKRKKLI